MKKLSLVHSFTTLLLGVGILNLSSCGGGGGSSSGDAQRQQDEVAVDAELEGQYMAKLQTINQTAAGFITGSVTMAREKKELLSDVRFSGLHPNLIHSQYIHSGTSCPTNDDNGDGFIDAVESAKASGGILIPLDGDLSSQDRGSSTFPVSDPVGVYTYSEITSYDRFIDDLREEDRDLDDDFVKIGADKNLNFEGRIVIIYGVAPETVLPETVARRGRLANFQTLPVACGVFRKVTSVPGTVDDDSGMGPAPEGETVGGGNGDDDGSTVVIGGGSGGGGTGEDLPDSTGGSTGGGEPGPTTPPTENEEDGGFVGGFVGGWHWPWPGGTTGLMSGGGESTLEN